MNRFRMTAAAAAVGIAAGTLALSFGPASALAGGQSSANLHDYQITTVQLSTGSTATIKYNQVTGEAWVLRNDRLIPIVDEANMPNSMYVVDVTSTEKGRWSAVRLDANTGNLWHVQDGTWIQLNEIGTPVSAVQE